MAYAFAVREVQQHLTTAQIVLYLALLPHELGQVRIRLGWRVEAVVDRDAPEVRLRLAQSMEMLACLAWLIGHVVDVGRLEKLHGRVVETAGESEQDRQVGRALQVEHPAH